VRYKQQNGDCLIPRRYPQDQELAQWVGFQRMRFRQGSLRPDRKAKLDLISFVYNVSIEQRTDIPEKQWEARYQELVEFQRVHGHCRVPSLRKATKESNKKLQGIVDMGQCPKVEEIC